MNKTISELKTEICYHVEVNEQHAGTFGNDKIEILQWILKEPQQVAGLARTSIWDRVSNNTDFIIEIGPRFDNKC